MLRFVVLAALVAGLIATRTLPEPGELALLLGEEEFEDYLDAWLALEQPKWTNATRDSITSGIQQVVHIAHTPEHEDCKIKVNGDLGQPQPVYLHKNNYIVPTGNTGVIDLRSGEQVLIACTGSGRLIRHPSINSSVNIATATCVNNSQVSGAGWLDRNGEFGDLVCSSHSNHEAQYTGERCYGNNQVIRVGFEVDGVFYPKYWTCFDASRLEVLYAWYEQNPHNAVNQNNVGRPGWLASSFYPGVGINNKYTLLEQKAIIARLVGEELAEKYVTSTQYLARGHLAAKTDFVFATGQRASFYFINAAPQWQPFNAGNWNWLEQNLRTRIGVAGYTTLVYTGTWGVLQLRNQNNNLVDIYLHSDANNNPQLPVPLYYYKVVYASTSRLGTAFISINSPYYSEEEVRRLTFCTDLCRNNEAFSWLRWQPDRIDIGYSFCCAVDDFRKTVPHLPAFTVNGILT